MAFSICIVVLAAWSITLTASQRNPCPTPEAIRPCTCDYSGINCMKAKTTEALQAVFGRSRPKEHRGLWIQRTPLSSFPVGVFGDFKFVNVFIDLNKNLMSFSLDVLANSNDTLQDLSLYGNGLSRVDYDSLAKFGSLETLNLAQNELTAIPTAAFKNAKLETLVLSKNPIEAVGAFAFAGLPNLENLKMKNTRLKSLGANSMTIYPHNPELKIEIDSGRIKTIHPKAFENTAPLELTLSYNQMTSFPEDVFWPIINGTLQNLKTGLVRSIPKVFTRGNQFTCRGCDFKWMVPYPKNQVLRAILSDFACVDGKRFANLSSALIGC